VLKGLDGGKAQGREQGRRGRAAIAAADHFVVGGVVAQRALSKTQSIEGPARRMGAGEGNRLSVAVPLFQGFVVNERQVDDAIEGENLCVYRFPAGDGLSEPSVAHELILGGAAGGSAAIVEGARVAVA